MSEPSLDAQALKARYVAGALRMREAFLASDGETVTVRIDDLVDLLDLASAALDSINAAKRPPETTQDKRKIGG